MKNINYAFLFVSIIILFGCNSSKPTLSKVYKKLPYNITIIYDNATNENELSELLKLNAIKDSKINKITVNRLTESSSFTTFISPTTFIENSSSYRDLYDKNANYFKPCEKVDELLQKDESSSLFVYAKQVKNVCKLNSQNQMFKDFGSLNDAIQEKIFSDSKKKVTSNIYIYVPSPEEKPECDIIENCEVQFNLNKAFYSIDDNESNLHYIFPVGSGSTGGYYYLICNKVCSAKAFKFEFSSTDSKDNYKHVFTLEENSIEYSLPNTYVFRIPQGSIAEEIEFSLKITPLEYDSRISRTTSPQRIERIIFKHCTN
jgi:hypothetical protein